MKKHVNEPQKYTFTRYLESKKSVDDRALNQKVWANLSEELNRLNTSTVVEVGAGIGTMLERLLEAGILREVHYFGLDKDPENTSLAGTRLPAWARKHGFQIEQTSPGCFHLERFPQVVSVEFKTADVLDYVEQADHWRSCDLLIAHAFLDLTDIPFLLPRLFQLLVPKGLFYFTINYDGLTILEPAVAAEMDRKVLELYHETMDKRLTGGLPSGDSQTGRKLFHHIQKAGGHILAAGPSDWVVFAGENGYPLDEAYFLHFIIHTISTALKNHPGLDLRAFEEWLSARHAQITASELVYIAHQIDFLGKI